MQRWQDELTKHPLNTTVKQLLDLLERDLPIDDPVIATERARFAKVVYLLRDAISSLDPDVAPFDLLNQIQNQLQSNGVPQTAQSIQSGGEIGLFRDLNTRLEPALSYIVQLRSGVVGAKSANVDAKAATYAFERFSRISSTRLKDFQSKVSEAEKRGLAAAQQVQDIHEQVKSSGDAFQAQVATWTADITNTFATQKNEFANAQAKIKSDFSQTISEIKSAASDELKTFFSIEEAEAKNRRATLESQLEGISASAQDMHEKIRVLYGLVARDSVTGGHKDIADREHDAAMLWQWVTVLSIGATVVWLLYSLFCLTPALEPERVFWLQIGKSVSLTILMLSFAVYASKQAALYRISERRARSFFLQVQAFDPFIEGLPESLQHELKQALSARIFGPDDPEHDKAVLEHGDFKGGDRLLLTFEQIKKLVGK